MKTVYLKDGQEALLVREIDKDNFIVEPMMVYYSYEGDENVEPSGEHRLVTEIFLKPPIAKKHDDLIKVIEKTEAKNKELAKVEGQLRLAKDELRESEQYKTDLQKLIINKSELKKAKRITVFESNSYTPRTLTPNQNHGIRINMNYIISEEGERSWYYELTEYDGNYSHRIDDKIGFILNATDEELDAIAKEKVASTPVDKIRSYDLARIPDKYLTPELKARKDADSRIDKNVKVTKLEEEIKSKQKQVKDLKKQ